MEESENHLRSVFVETRESLSESIIADLADYRHKRVMGLAGMYGDHMLSSEDHTHMYIYIYRVSYVHIYMVCTCIYIHIQSFICTCICTWYAHVHIEFHMYMHMYMVCTCIYRVSYVHAYVHGMHMYIL